MFIFLKTKMATSQARFKCTDEKLIDLIKCLLECKNSMEFRNCNSDAGKVKLYESVRKSPEEIYDDESDVLKVLLRTCSFFSKTILASN